MRSMRDWYQQAWQHSREAIRLIDEDGLLVDANEAYCNLVQKPRRALMGRCFADLYAPHLRTQVLEEELRRFRRGVSEHWRRVHVELWNGHRLALESCMLLIGPHHGEPRLARIFSQVNHTSRTGAMPRSKDVFSREGALRDVVESAGVVVFTEDASGRITYVSPAIHTLVGYDSSEVVGRCATDFVHPEDLGRIPGAPADGPTVNLDHGECRLFAKDGTTRYVRTASRTILPHGEPPFRLGALVDITEQKRAQEALRDDEVFLDSIVTNIPHLVLVKRADDLTFVRLSDACEKLLGHPKREMIGKTDLDFFPASQAEFSARADRQVIQTKRFVDIPEEEITTTGGTRIMHTRKMPIADRDGSVRFVVGFSEDITEKKRGEEALRESREKFEKAFHDSPAVFTISTIAEGKFLEVNESFEQTLGYLREEVVGKDTFELDMWENHEERAQLLQKLSGGTSVRGQEVRLRTKNGDVLVVLLSADLIDLGGRACLLTVFVDITERKRLQSQLLQAQKIQSLGTLAAGIAHDFNNILNIISGNAFLLDRLTHDQPETSRRIEAIRKATDRGSHLVGQLLTFARKREIEQKALLVNDVLHEVSHLMEEALPKSIIVTLALAPDLPLVVGDPTQLHQVFVNLCVNARDAMPNGGTLAITTTSVTGESVRRKFAKASAREYVLAVVRDSGAGMDSNVRRRIFDPFFTTKGVGKGTGLGLSVALGIVDSHGGFIEVESHKGLGTEFRVYLPSVDQFERTAGEQSTPLPSSGGRGELILLIEDEVMGRQMLAEFLQCEGYTVLCASDGEEGIRTYGERQGDIALVLTDLGLPKCDGEEVSRCIRTMSDRVPIILMSGYLDPAKADHLKSIGVDEVLPKPYALVHLVACVRDALDRSRR